MNLVVNMELNLKCYKFKNKRNEELSKECEKLEIESFPNGYRIVRRDSDYVICAFNGDELIGFLSLNVDWYHNNDFYVSEIAVRKDYRKYGVGTEMLKLAIKHSGEFDVLTAHVLKSNVASNALFNKFMKISDCSCIKESEDRYFYIIDISKIADRKNIEELLKTRKVKR